MVLRVANIGLSGCGTSLWDYSVVLGDDARIENLVAAHLLKFCHFLEDTEGYRVELQFLRDREEQEVDFLVAVDRKPWFAVEVKKRKDRSSSSLRYFADRLHIPYLYHVVWIRRRVLPEASS